MEGMCHSAQGQLTFALSSHPLNLIYGGLVSAASDSFSLFTLLATQLVCGCMCV